MSAKRRVKALVVTIIIFLMLAGINFYFASRSASRLSLYFIAKRNLASNQSISPEDVAWNVGRIQSGVGNQRVSALSYLTSKYTRRSFLNGEPLDARFLGDHADLGPLDAKNVIVPIQVQAWTGSTLMPGMIVGIVQRGSDTNGQRTFFLDGHVLLRAITFAPEPAHQLILFLEIPITEIDQIAGLSLKAEDLTAFEIHTALASRTLPSVIFYPVYFDSNSAAVRQTQSQALSEDARILKHNPSLVVYVDGYCDASGNTTYNFGLSYMRAESVARYLKGEGASASSLVTRAFGKANYAAPNDTSEGRLKNRRVDLIVAPMKQQN